jgi:LysM repeat protein
LKRQSAETADRRLRRRREHPRAVIDWPVTVITITATHQGKTINLSRGGVLIHLKHQLDIGEKVRLAIEIPDCQDAIVAKAEVVRVFPLKRGVEQPLSHGIALKFTELSENNWKYFSGNFASEWREDYSEVDRHAQAELPQPVDLLQRNKEHRHYALWIFGLIIIIPILYLLSVSFEDRADNQHMIAQLDKRILILQEQIQSYRDVINSLEHLENELNNFQIELSNVQEHLPATDTLESMSVALTNQSQLIQQISDKIKNYQKPGPVDPEADQHQQKDQFYVVKKGDTLYQISSQTGITIGELKLLNRIDSNDPIIPGQKLIIK